MYTRFYPFVIFDQTYQGLKQDFFVSKSHVVVALVAEKLTFLTFIFFHPNEVNAGILLLSQRTVTELRSYL